MDTMRAFLNAEIARRNRNPRKIFDWDRAARRIREVQPNEARAGLSDDWEYTGGTIYRNGEPVLNDHTFLASIWATPELEMDGVWEDCYIEVAFDQEHQWDSSTKWPTSALEILKEGSDQEGTTIQ